MKSGIEYGVLVGWNRIWSIGVRTTSPSCGIEKEERDRE